MPSANAICRRMPRRRFIESLELRQLLAASLNGGLLNITGTSGNDEILLTSDGTDLTVTINGTPTAFTQSQVTSIEGELGDGNDSIRLPAGLNIPATLAGEAGDDTLAGGSASDSIDGGDGSDEVTYAARNTPITGNLIASLYDPFNSAPPAYYVRITGTVAATGGESDALVNVETLTGGNGNDTLSTDVVDDMFWTTVQISGARPPIRISGGGGNDSLNLSSGYYSTAVLNSVPMTADGGAGNDALSGGDISQTTFIGGDGDDSFNFGNDDSSIPTVTAGAGFDSAVINLPLGVTSYTIPLGLEEASFSSTNNALTITGNAEDNVINVGPTATVSGGDGDDRITLGNGGIARGDGGNDTLTGSGNADTLEGGDGNDSLVSAGGNDRVRGDGGNDKIDTGDGDDVAYGGDGDDTLSGQGGRDTLRGENGNDRLYGNGGSDSLYGGDGSDRMYGSAGLDLLDGGGGRDYFYGGDDRDRAKKQKMDRVIKEIEQFI